MVNLRFLPELSEEGIETKAVRAVTLYEHAIVKGNSGRATCNFAMTTRDDAEGLARKAVHTVGRLEIDLNERKQSKCVVCLGDKMRDGADDAASDTNRAARLYEMAIEEDKDVEAVAKVAALEQDRSAGSMRNGR